LTGAPAFEERTNDGVRRGRLEDLDGGACGEAIQGRSGTERNRSRRVRATLNTENGNVRPLGRFVRVPFGAGLSGFVTSLATPVLEQLDDSAM